MRASLVAVPLLALALAGCDSKDSVVAKDESVASVAEKVAASDLKPKPGRWESTMKVDAIDIPGMPPQAKEAMGRQFASTGQGFATCLTPEQASKPEGDFFRHGAAGCTYDRFVMSDGRIDAEMTCKNDGGGTMKMTLAGTYAEESYSVAMTSQGEMQPGMPMTMKMTVNSRRTGDCNGTEQ